MLTVHVPVPVQAPLHPVKLLEPSGVAVSVTVVPPSKTVLQLVPQLIPLGLLLITPPPVPAFVTNKGY